MRVTPSADGVTVIDACAAVTALDDETACVAETGCTYTDAVSVAVAVYSCTCVSGREGDAYEVDTNECHGTPCGNGGTCTDSNVDASIALTSYLCACAAGWEGLQCLTDSDECAINLCENGATCSESSTQDTVPQGYYWCTCVAGWSGENCATDVDECASDPCLNGATCIESGSDVGTLVTQPVVGTCKYTRCGSSELDSCRESFHCASPADRHEVTCCTDDDSSTNAGFAQRYPGTCSDIWGAREDTGAEDGTGDYTCQSNLNWAEAGAFCGLIGGRLCTTDELDRDCSRGGGCDLDTELVWTSTDGGGVPVDQFSCNCADGWGNGICAEGSFSVDRDPVTQADGYGDEQICSVEGRDHGICSVSLTIPEPEPEPEPAPSGRRILDDEQSTEPVEAAVLAAPAAPAVNESDQVTEDQPTQHRPERYHASQCAYNKTCGHLDHTESMLTEYVISTNTAVPAPEPITPHGHRRRLESDNFGGKASAGTSSSSRPTSTMLTTSLSSATTCGSTRRLAEFKSSSLSTTETSVCSTSSELISSSSLAAGCHQRSQSGGCCPHLDCVCAI